MGLLPPLEPRQRVLLVDEGGGHGARHEDLAQRMRLLEDESADLLGQQFIFKALGNAIQRAPSFAEK